MTFSQKQTRALRQSIRAQHVRSREVDGRAFSFIEGWHAIAEANRIFGFDGWDRETIDLKCVAARAQGAGAIAIYTAKVRIIVRSETGNVVREGTGASEGRGATAYEAHSMGLKGAETDATKRALATFGHPFGLTLYSDERKDRPSHPVVGDGRRDADRPSPTPQTLARCGADSGAMAPRAPVRTVPQGSHRSFSPRSQAPNGGDGSHPPADMALGNDGQSTEERPLKPQPSVAQESHRVDARPPRNSIDKSTLAFGLPKRHRDKQHLRFVALQNCLVCGLKPADAHHVKFAQPRAIGLKVSDEFTVPLCRGHHRELHNSGNERAWWHDMSLEPLPIARRLWVESRAQTQTSSSGGTGEKSTDQPTNHVESVPTRATLSDEKSIG